MSSKNLFNLFRFPTLFFLCFFLSAVPRPGCSSESSITPDALQEPAATDNNSTVQPNSIQEPSAPETSNETPGVKIEGQTPELRLFWDTHRNILPWDYAYVKTIPAPVFSRALSSLEKARPVRMLDGGPGTFRWVSLEEPYPVKSEDLKWFIINPGEYIEASHLKRFWPSDFKGVNLQEHPLEGRYGWIVFETYASTVPGKEQYFDGDLFKKHTLVKILETRHINGWDWHRLGKDQWVEQRRVAQIKKAGRPASIPDDANWIDINLYEQTIAAYQGDEMIYVSLVSSGLPEFETRKGIFRIWAKVRFAKMGGGEKGKNYYWLEDVPYHMYFFQGYAIHGAYWHNNFGVKQSHGCVNISCLDAKWFFEWTLPAVKNDKWLVNKKAGNATWVWVHD